MAMHRVPQGPARCETRGCVLIEGRLLSIKLHEATAYLHWQKSKVEKELSIEQLTSTIAFDLDGEKVAVSREMMLGIKTIIGRHILNCPNRA